MEGLSKQENEKRLAGYKAGEWIKDGMTLGLGTGSTAFYAIQRAGELVRDGYTLRAVATSEATAKLARELNIEVLDIDEVERIDLAIDGVDEIDPEFNAIKGGGAAHFREKIVATLADRVIWIMDSSKQVEHIGAFGLPIEILTFGHIHTLRYLAEAGLEPKIRYTDAGEPKISDNGNMICDLELEAGFDIDEVVSILDRTVGVIEHGLFLKTCNLIIVGRGDDTEVLYRI